MNWKNLWNNKSRLLSLWLAVMLLLLSGCSHIQPLEPGISDGGTLTKHLRALLASDFIVRYIPSGGLFIAWQTKSLSASGTSLQ